LSARKVQIVTLGIKKEKSKKERRKITIKKSKKISPNECPDS